MEKLEKIIKLSLLSVFCVLNIIDMAQAVSLIEIERESNDLAVNYPHLWFPFKFAFPLGLSIGLYKLDIYLERKEDRRINELLESSVALMYLIIVFSDIFLVSVVVENMATLGRLV